MVVKVLVSELDYEHKSRKELRRRPGSKRRFAREKGHRGDNENLGRKSKQVNAFAPGRFAPSGNQASLDSCADVGTNGCRHKRIVEHESNTCSQLLA